jgi:tRNA G18 (ribose-2'-O)-methylase SpoU
MGSVLRTPYARVHDWPGDLAVLKREGFTIVALTPRDGAVDLTACVLGQPHRRLALLVGSEGPGLTTEAQSMADVRVRIPIAADVDSLNVATATGIALYHFANHQPRTTNH